MNGVNLRKLTLKELKVLAGQKLGELAAKLKTKDELVSALEKLVPAAKEVLKPKLVPVTAAQVKPAPTPKPKLGEPKLPKAEAAPVKPTVVPKKVAPAPKPAPVAAARPVAKAEAPLPKVTVPLPPEPARALTVTQDFFTPPGTARLPSAHGDDRVLAFPRDTGGLYVSWDFSLPTWGDGPATLEVIEGDEVLAGAQLDAPWGGRFIDVSSRSPVFVAVRRGPLLLGRSAFLSLPPGRAGTAARKKLAVRWSEPLPTRTRPMPSDKPFKLSSTTRVERSEASSSTREVESETFAISDVTSRMA